MTTETATTPPTFANRAIKDAAIAGYAEICLRSYERRLQDMIAALPADAPWDVGMRIKTLLNTVQSDMRYVNSVRDR